MMMACAKNWLALYLSIIAFPICLGYLQPTAITQRFPYSSRYELSHFNNRLTFPTSSSLTYSSIYEYTRSYSSSDLHATPDTRENISTESSISSNTEKPTGQQILSLAIPALAGLAIDPLMTLADTAFVGRDASNADALAGVGSAAALLTFSFYLFNFLCTATTPLVSQRRASGDEDGAISVGGQALSLAVILGVCLTIVLLTFSQPLLQVMGTENTGIDANTYATSFLQIRSLAAPAVFLTSASIGILRGYLDTQTTFIILAGANIINFCLDIILIPGLGMGPTGAALATTTAEWISALSFLGVLGGILPSTKESDLGKVIRNYTDSDFANNESEYTESPHNQIRIFPTVDVPRWADFKPLLVASSSAFIRSLVLQMSIAGAAAMAARATVSGATVDGASASVAAHQIALQMWLLCSFVCDALAAASQALVADAVGRENQLAIRNVSKTVILYSLALGVFLSVGLEIGDLTNFLLDFFTKDAATQNALKPLLSIIILAQPLNSFVFAADGILQGASQFSYQAKAMVISVVVGISSFVTMDYILYDEYGMNTLIHVWYALVVLQMMRGLTSMVKLIEKDGPFNLIGTKSFT